MPSQIIHPIADADYRALPGVPQSTLKHFSQSPAHVRWAMDHKTERTPDMLIGIIVDSMVFKTPFLYTTSPFDSFRSKAAQEWLVEQEARGVEVVTQDTLEKCKRMADAVATCRDATPFLSQGRAQVAMTADFTLGATVERKGLADWVSDSHLVIADLKTTQDASPSGFSKTIWNYRYDVQAAYYLDLYRDASGEADTRTFVFIAVEKTEPHAVAVYYLDENAVGSGRRQYIEWIQKFMECRDTGLWPGYTTNQPLPIGLPKWAS